MTRRLKSLPSEEHYSLEEVHKLLLLDDVPMMVLTGLYTGMRKGELFGLTWECIHFDSQTPWIDVRRNYDGPTKNRKPRPVPLHPELLPILRQWRQQCPQTEEKLVFPVLSERGGMGAAKISTWRMGTKHDMEDLRELLTKADVRSDFKRPWHAFRHSLSTLFLEATGGNGDALGKILGHSAGGGGMAKVTLGYTHTGLSYLYQEMCKLSLLPPAPEGVIPLRKIAK